MAEAVNRRLEGWALDVAMVVLLGVVTVGQIVVEGWTLLKGYVRGRWLF